MSWIDGGLSKLLRVYDDAVVMCQSFGTNYHSEDCVRLLDAKQNRRKCERWVGRCKLCLSWLAAVPKWKQGKRLGKISLLTYHYEAITNQLKRTSGKTEIDYKTHGS
jgi:hypothetical protein